MSAFKACKENKFNFEEYVRKFLQPDDLLVKDLLNSQLNTKIAGAIRNKFLLTKNLNEAFELLDKSNINDIDIEQLAKAKAVFHEALFLIKLKQHPDILSERATEIQSAYNSTWSIVEAKDVNDLSKLQNIRDDFLDQLPLVEGWKEQLFGSGYCEGMIYSCLVLSDPETAEIAADFDEVTQMIVEYKYEDEEEHDSNKKDVRSMIKAYAFVIKSLKIERFDIEFVRKINAILCAEIDKNEEEANKKGGKFALNAREKLLKFVDWLNFAENSVDPVSRAIIGHIGVINLHPFKDRNFRTARLLQDFLLMRSGYPPACIFKQLSGEFKYTAQNMIRFVGNDHREFFRLIIDGCLQKTFDVLLEKFVEPGSEEKVDKSDSKSSHSSKSGEDKNGSESDEEKDESKSAKSAEEKGELGENKGGIDISALHLMTVEQAPVGSPLRSIKESPAAVSMQSHKPDSDIASMAGGSGSIKTKLGERHSDTSLALAKKSIAMEIEELITKAKGGIQPGGPTLKGGEEKSTKPLENPYAYLFGQALPPGLLQFSPSTLAPLPVKHVYNGWAVIFEEILRAKNEDLLKFEE